MRKFFISAAAAFILFSGMGTAVENPVIGVVNFAACVTESKAGKKEQENIESMRKQMTTLIEDTEKELKEVTTNLEDPEYLDSLSPKAEEELKNKHQALQEDLGRYQNQFYQVLNHTNYQMIQKLSGTIAKASGVVASQKNLDYVMNKEACFYIRPDLDITDQVISEMDKSFETEEKPLSDADENLKLKTSEATSEVTSEVTSENGLLKGY